MESSNFYQLQQHQLGCYSSLPPQSTHGVAAPILEWNPSLHLNNDDYDHYMNEILPNSTQLVTKNANFGDMGCDEYERCPNPPTIQNAVDDLNENLWLSTHFSERQLYPSKTSWASPAAFSSNNYVLNNITIASSDLGLSISSLESTDHLAINFMSNYLNNSENCTPSSKAKALPSYSQSTSSNKTSECRNKAISRTKRVSSTTSHDEAAKKQRAISQSSSPLPKVGKEKIGGRIAALHRLVAPFGKTDAASVLTEAIGYIQFLQHQIQTLSMPPCLKPSHGDRHRCFQGVFSKQDEKEFIIEGKQDLRSRGLCLVPLSIASHISSSCAGFDAI